MTKKNLLLLLFVFLVLFTISGCKNGGDEHSGIEVIYDLNGGIFQNCKLPIKQYYNYGEGAKQIIVDPETLVKDEIEKSGYTLEGWYTEKDFINKWDFENDVITNEGLTLYAKWKKDILFTYNVCYIDDVTNELVIIDSYEVEQGQKFVDYRKYASKRDGYTPFRFCDEQGNDWDNNFTHPGGESDLAINVYVEYIKGEYALVSNKTDFINALNKNQNIYLLNDIDLENEEISFGDFSNKQFVGNNYKVSNFKVTTSVEYPHHLSKDHADSSKNSVYVSLFGNVEDSTIENVTFENVKFEVSVSPARTYKIYLAALTTSNVNARISNVKVSATYELIKLPNNFDEENSVIIYYTETHIIKSENSVLENILLELK